MKEKNRASIDVNKNIEFLKLDSNLPKELVLFASKPFKNDEKCFLFHRKSSFRSQDI